LWSISKIKTAVADSGRDPLTGFQPRIEAAYALSPVNRHDRKSQLKMKVFPETGLQVMAGAQKEDSRTGILPVLLGGGASRQAFPGRSLGTRRKILRGVFQA
jgi:hypothetical protein